MFRQVTIIDVVHDKEEIPKSVLEALKQHHLEYDYRNDAYISGDFENINTDMDDTFPARAWLESLGLEPSKVLFSYWW